MFSKQNRECYLKKEKRKKKEKEKEEGQNTGFSDSSKFWLSKYVLVNYMNNATDTNCFIIFLQTPDMANSY